MKGDIKDYRKKNTQADEENKRLMRGKRTG